MAAHNIDRTKVERGVNAVLRELNSMPYGEALVVLSEALGRMIVEVCDTPVQMTNMADVAMAHIGRTLQAGAAAKGFGGGA